MNIKRGFLVLSILLLIVGEPQARANKISYKSYIGKYTLSSKGSQKTYTYYAFGKIKPCELLLYGPGEFTFYFRATRKGNAKLLIDGKKSLTVKIDTEYSTKAYFAENPSLAITKAKGYNLKLSRGKHKIKIETPLEKAFVRVKKKAQEKFISIQPNKFSSSAELLTKGKSYGYYEATPKNPLELTIIGPATLKLYSRILYKRGEEPMEIERIFRVKTKVKTRKIKRGYNYSTESLLGKQPVSKAHKTYIKLPKGKQTVIVKPEEGSIYFRVYIPASALKRK